ncbi:uncharacterized protein [Chelonus insularis]|uniref:uncharacterized protein n=1 Tax=Chelonus insularis TaxID=460826 RepID=UPI00158AF749|nr:uncharacterized protein LOC118071386 [Chelonus insularis]
MKTPSKKKSSLINDEVFTCQTLCDTSDNENSINNCDVSSQVIDATDKADDRAHSLQEKTFPLSDELPSPEQMRNASSMRDCDSSYDVSLPMIDTEDEDYVPTSEVSQQNKQDVIIEPNNESVVIPDPSISSGARNPEEMYVVPLGDKKRRDFCYYCHTFLSVISRHVELKHKDQPEVKAFAMMPKGKIA